MPLMHLTKPEVDCGKHSESVVKLIKQCRFVKVPDQQNKFLDHCEISKEFPK